MKKKLKPIEEMERQIWWLRFDRSSRLWKLTHNDQEVEGLQGAYFKETVESSARQIARTTAKEKEIIIELRICRKNGTIQDSCTYPRRADPRNSKG